MIQKIKIIMATILLSLGVAGAFASPALAATGAAGDAKNDVCSGINTAGGTCSDSGKGLQSVIRLVIRIISVVAGFAAVIMIMIGGLRYITSGGDSSKVSSAKQAIIYAIVGLVIVIFAQIIVRFVAKEAS